MNYKSVLEEQIRELQKIQDNLVARVNAEEACEVARTILVLIQEAKGLSR